MFHSLFQPLETLAENAIPLLVILFIRFLFDSPNKKRILSLMHSERREVNARQPDNKRCHGLAKGDAPRKGNVDGQPHLTSALSN
jgi:hypothetical protein